MNNEPLKILVVDDNPVNIVAIKTCLEPLKATIHDANNGNAALSLMIRNHYSLVLSDINMPNMDGFELSQLIQTNPETYDTPVILTTVSLNGKDLLDRAYQSGAIDCYVHPFPVEQFTNKIKNITSIIYRKNQKEKMKTNVLKKMIHSKEKILKKFKKKNSLLSDLAYIDSLTMVSNRAGFEKQLTEKLEIAKRYKHTFALLMLDVDHFKIINDTYGHNYGDIFLQEIVSRIKLNIRKTDFIARVGGDEFSIILQEIKSFHDAGRVAENILNEMSKSFNIINKEIRASVSIGIAYFPDESSDEEITSAEMLVSNADIAMYLAKEQRNNTYAFYTAEFNLKHKNQIIIENSLKFALDRNEFFLAYQPQVDMKTKNIVGVEALLRWQHPEKGLILPKQFIHTLEETHMITQTGFWIMRRAFEQFISWKKTLGYGMKIAINISPQQLAEHGFLENTKSLVEEYQIDPNLIELELTETAIMEDFSALKNAIFRLSDMGFIISIDDFGTGYSRLSYLKTLPLRALKIDLEFIKDIEENESSATIVRAIIDLAKNFNLQVIAEGVEKKEQAQFLLKNNCKHAQGFLYSKPILPDQLEAYLKL